MSTDAIKQELAKQDERAEAGTIYDALEVHAASLERKVPMGVMTYAYAEASLLTALRENPKLRECDPAKVLGAFSATLALGLPLGPLGLVYLVPYGGDVVPIIGYQGYIELSYRSGKLKDVSAVLVHDGDDFAVELGTSPKIRHVPNGPARDRPIVAAYAVAHLKTGGTVFRVMYEDDWEEARKASVIGRRNQGPWMEFRPQMIRKTAYRRLWPQLPKSADLLAAASVDETPAPPYAIEDYRPALEASATEAGQE